MPDSHTSSSSTNIIQAVLALADEEALEEALSGVSPVVAAQTVAAASTLPQKTAILWALDDRHRREVLELVPPALIGALVQNLEEDNRYLLGDLSLQQFRALLGLCSPERKYYWLTTALSFTDARANALPLLIPTRELVEILLTRAEFEEQLRAIAEFPLEAQRLPPELLLNPAQTLVDLFGPENFLHQFPIADPALAHFLQTVLDYDPDRYVDLIREGLRDLNYAENHPDEWEELTEEPVLLESVEPVEVLPDDVEIPDSVPEAATEPPLALVPVRETPLARAARALPPALQQRVSEDLQYLYIRQAIAEGGSFLLSDLQNVARSVEAYVLLGLQAESGGRPEREAAVLATRPLHRVSQSGARVVERLRQVALRLVPLRDVLSAAQRAVVRSIARPRLTLSEEGRPLLYLLPGEGLPETADLPLAGRLLQEVVAWTEIARALGLERIATRLRAGATVFELQEDLALAAVLYSRMELGLATADDPARFARRYVSPEKPEPDERAREGLARVVTQWSGERRIDPALILPLFSQALDRLALRGANA